MNPPEKSIDAVVAGHLCLDLNPAFAARGSTSLTDILIPGKLINVGPAALSTGGAVSNTGISLRLLGMKTSLMGKTGDDLLGSVVRQILDQYDVSNGLIVDPDASTSYSVVIAPPGIDRIFLHHPGANDSFCAQDIDLGIVRSARLFHFGYPPLMQRMYQDQGDELARMLRLVRAEHVTTSLDLALPDPASPAGQADWAAILGKILPLTDIFLPSLEELVYMLDRPAFERIKSAPEGVSAAHAYGLDKIPDLALQLLDLGVRIVVIKLGQQGLYVRTAGQEAIARLGPARPADPRSWSQREIWSEIFQVDHVASTSGAGDASIAGFLAGLLSGQSIETASQLACAVAGLKIQVKTSVGGILPLADVLARLPHWPKTPLTLDTTYWRYDQAARLWFGANDRNSQT